MISTQGNSLVKAPQLHFTDVVNGHGGHDSSWHNDWQVWGFSEINKILRIKLDNEKL